MTLLVNNWKMAPDTSSMAHKLSKEVNVIARKYKKFFTLIVCPPFIHIPLVSKNAKNVIVGAQNVSSNDEVAQTGQVSSGMLKDYGIKYCIVGHSEARELGESDEMISLKVLRLINKNITPILCVGEKERDSHGWYLGSVKEQIEVALSGIPKSSMKSIVIAYEPVWAIGAKSLREATPKECHEMIIYIRKVLSDMSGEKIANSARVIYGGSVDEMNASKFITEGKAQGLLIGRLSLDAKRFAKLAETISLIK